MTDIKSLPLPIVLEEKNEKKQSVAIVQESELQATIDPTLQTAIKELEMTLPIQEYPISSKIASTWKIVQPIDSYLFRYGLIALPVIVNIATLNLNVGSDETYNSVILATPSGSSKTTFLENIERNNPEWCPSLPPKIFETDILQEPDEKFNRKIWIQDDLITTFRGTSTKQREQLMGFFNTFLTKGEYGRKNIRKKGKILCVFGLAKEHYMAHAKEMFQETFKDRFATIQYDIDEGDMRKILDLRSKRKLHQLPPIILPLKSKCVDIDIPNDLNPEINRLAMILHNEHVMSAVRAQTHIFNFVKANADINGRSQAMEDDLKLFKFILPLYLGTSSGRSEVKVRQRIMDSSMRGFAVSGRVIKDWVVAETGHSERDVERELTQLRDENIVNYAKVPNVRGYDYIYWL